MWVYCEALEYSSFVTVAQETDRHRNRRTLGDRLVLVADRHFLCRNDEIAEVIPVLVVGAVELEFAPVVECLAFAGLSVEHAECVRDVYDQGGVSVARRMILPLACTTSPRGLASTSVLSAGISSPSRVMDVLAKMTSLFAASSRASCFILPM